jgi:pilus assembly protein CpaE
MPDSGLPGNASDRHYTQPTYAGKRPMAANPILICAPTDELRAELETQLGSAGYVTTSVTTPAAAVGALRDGSFDLVMAEGLAVSGAIGRIRAAASEPTPVLVVAPADDVEARIAFLEAGADDVVSTGFARHELAAKVEALLIRAGRVTPEAARSGLPSGEIVTFFSPKGGVGTTTLAVNTAVLLAGGMPGSGPGAKVLLVDMDLQFGQVATHLNLSPRFDLAGLAGDEPALSDPELAMSYLTQHASGIQVLAAPTHPDADFRVSVDQLERALAVLRPRFDEVIVDCGSRLDPRSLWMLEQASTHVFVIFPEIAALRATSVLLGFLAETATLRAKTHFVVNHIFPKELLKTRDVENLLRTKPAAEIPYTEIDMIRAVNEGVPVVTSRPGTPVALALTQVAQAIVGIEAGTGGSSRSRRRRGLFSRR